jgi:hypothetical protein
MKSRTNRGAKAPHNLKTKKMKLLVVEDPSYGDSSVRINQEILSCGFYDPQDAIDAAKTRLAAFGVNVSNIWSLLDEKSEPDSSARFYEAEI